MNVAEFRATLQDPAPPAGIPASLAAMWHDAKGDWDQAHNIAQDISGREGSWIHAYLHRKEGDAWNAGYWYTRAGRSMPNQSLDEEWVSMVSELLLSHP